MLYLIPFLHQTTTALDTVKAETSCILFHFYIKPQPATMHTHAHTRCILFHFYIKPQQRTRQNAVLPVVSYSISTSNHNCQLAQRYVARVVSYSISTSNHNIKIAYFSTQSLYLIPFLHQTTTASSVKRCVNSCILFHFYIKPQLMAHKTLFSSTLSPKSHSHFQRNAVV